MSATRGIRDALAKIDVLDVVHMPMSQLFRSSIHSHAQMVSTYCRVTHRMWVWARILLGAIGQRLERGFAPTAISNPGHEAFNTYDNHAKSVFAA
jgi:hypothetical protein